MKDYLSEYLNDYINGDPRKAVQESLLQELTDFGQKQDDTFTGHKAHRIYVKALVRKKAALANRIKAKYGHLFPKPDDSTLAFGFALMAASKQKP